MGMKEKELKRYIKRLGEILTKIEEAEKDKLPEKARQWYYYLQGYIKASQQIY